MKDIWRDLRKSINTSFKPLFETHYGYWYYAVLLPLTVYVLWNWSDILEIDAYAKLNGQNLLFFVWLFVLLMPLINKLTLFGFGGETGHTPTKPMTEKSVDQISAKIDNGGNVGKGQGTGGEE